MDQAQHTAVIAGAGLLATILSGLFIWGTLKKHSVLVATWLAAAFPLAGYFIGRLIYNTIKWGNHSVDNYLTIVLLTGAQAIVLYAICQLYLKIRRERAAVVKYFEPTKQPQSTEKSADCV